MSSREDIVATIQEHLLEQRRGHYEGTEIRFACPAHADEHPSARWNTKKNGGVWVCDVCHAGGGYRDLGERLGLIAQKESRKLVATYDYTDEQGTVLFQVCRFAPKDFRQRRPDGNGGFVYKLDGVRRVLYRLPQLLTADPAQPVYVVEGERDVDALAALGLTATTNPGGAGKWLSEYNVHLRDRHVVVLPDADAPGRRHAEEVRVNLEPVAASVCVLALPGLPPKGDVSTWLAAGGTRETLEALVAAARATRPETEEAPSMDDSSAPGARVILVAASSIRPERVRWGWGGRVALGTVNLLVGDPGLGKSTLTVDLAARLSRGQLEGDLFGEPVTIALATAEDAVAHVVVPRLMAAGADRDRVKIIEVERDGLTGGLLVPQDLGALRDCVMADGVRCVVIDPLVAHLPGDVNSHRDQDVRRALAPLARLAEDADAAVVVVVHLNKSTLAHVLARVAGSVGFVAAARSVLLLGPDPEDPEGPTRILAHAKCNLGPLAPALRLRVEGREVVRDDDGTTIPISGIAWCGEAPGVTAQDLVTPESAEDHDATDHAIEILEDLLAGGPVKSKEIQKALRGVGIGRRAGDAAKRRLGLKKRKVGFTGSHWGWGLPEQEHEAAHSPNASIFGTNGSGETENPASNVEDVHLAEDAQARGHRAEDAHGDDEAFSVDGLTCARCGSPMPEDFLCAVCGPGSTTRAG